MDNKQVTKIVAASLLGDGCVFADDHMNTNARFTLTQIPEHKDHVDFIAGYIGDLTRVRINTTEPHEKLVCGKQSFCNGRYTITSMRHPFYTKFWNRMYPNNVKIIDPHYLTLLDWEFLAIWYMQDGCRGTKQGTKYRTPVLCTDNFSYGDHELLRHALIEKLDLVWNIRRHKRDKAYKYRLHISAKCVDRFIEGISPYIQNSFTYKLDVYD